MTRPNLPTAPQPVTQPLVDLRELTELVGGPAPPTLLDARWQLGGPPGLADFRTGHLPGAVFCDLERDLCRPPGAGGRHPLPTAADFTAAMRRLGVRGDRAVVVYDGGDGLAAARAWWCLRYFGHLRVRVLDGGYPAWVAAGRTVTSGEVAPEPGDFTAVPGGMELLDAAAAADLARTGLLLDVRAAERYRGEVEPLDPVAGHIPGAVSVPAPHNVTADGRYRSAGELSSGYAELGIRPGVLVGAYCGSGITAAKTVLALELAGIPATLYAGSWSDWITDPDRPVATGAQPG